MKTESYNHFWQRIHKSAKNKGFPLRAMFELTYRCNFFCPHCYVPFNYREKSQNRELKTKDIFLILDQLRDIGCFYLGFTGGEPFIREDIMDILWYAKKSGFEIIIYTNGSLIDRKIAGELSRIAPNKIDITIPAMSESVFESISGLSGCRNKVFEAVELLRKNEINLGFKTCILKENEAEISQIEDFARSLGAQHRLDNMPSVRLDGSKEPYKYRCSSKLNWLSPLSRLNQFSPLDSDKQPVANECHLTDLTGKTGKTEITKPDNLFYCGVGRSQAAITPFGELKMCLMIDYPKYKILETSLKDAWEKLRVLVVSIKPDKNYRCGECDLRTYCKWCPAMAWLYNGSFTNCEPMSYLHAQKTKQEIESPVRHPS